MRDNLLYWRWRVMNKGNSIADGDNPFKLTKKQKQFVEEYLITENATASYRRAYGQEDTNSASVGGSKTLKKDKIQAEIKRRKEQFQKDIRIASPEELLIKLTHMINDPDLKATEQLRAVELLGKNLGLFNDNQNNNANPTFTINLIQDEDSNNKSIQFVQQPVQSIEHLPVDESDDDSEYVDYEEID